MIELTQAIPVVAMEDEKSIAYLTNTVPKEGYLITHCKSAEECMRLVKHHYDNRAMPIVFTDINMGAGRQREGLLLLEKVKKLDQSIPTCVISAHTSQEERAKELGADQFIEKKFEIEPAEVAQFLKFAELQIRKSMLIKLLQKISDKSTVDKIEAVLKHDAHFVDLPEAAFPETAEVKEGREDANVEAFRLLKMDAERRRLYEGKYVAIHEGSIRGACDQLEPLMELIHKQGLKGDVFIGKVTDEVKSYRVLSPRIKVK